MGRKQEAGRPARDSGHILTRRSLLQSALLKYLQACEVIGCRALMVHAKDETAVRFYQGYGFEPSPIDAAHLYLLTKDIRKTLA